MQFIRTTGHGFNSWLWNLTFFTHQAWHLAHRRHAGVCVWACMWTRVALTWIQRGARLTFSTSSLAALLETGSTSPPASDREKHVVYNTKLYNTSKICCANIIITMVTCIIPVCMCKFLWSFFHFSNQTSVVTSHCITIVFNVIRHQSTLGLVWHSVSFV